MLKKLIFILPVFVFSTIFASCTGIDKNIADTKRDSRDTLALSVFNDFYEIFESDSGTANYLINRAAANMVKMKQNKNLLNRQLIIMLDNYANKMTKPDTALIILKELRMEFHLVYGYYHPLIDEYFAEMLIDKGNKNDAYKLMLKLTKTRPNSIMGQIYLYKSEPDPAKAAKILKKLKSEHPNHWIVKTLR